jgi:hypothetical protein
MTLPDKLERGTVMTTKLKREIERRYNSYLTLEQEGKKDYADMRKFQAKYVTSDREVRRLREQLAEATGHNRQLTDSLRTAIEFYVPTTQEQQFLDVLDATKEDHGLDKFGRPKLSYEKLEALLDEECNQVVALCLKLDQHRQQIKELNAEVERKVSAANFLLAERDRWIVELRQICRNAYEVWAGSEGIPEPTCASEAYLYQLLIDMRDEVKKGLTAIDKGLKP